MHSLDLHAEEGDSEWRLLGPHRGGRVVAVSGDPDVESVFYFGAAAGGVWRSADWGWSWRCVTDRYMTRGSIGSLAVAPSDGKIIYAGTGEACVRSDVVSGDGVYQSKDGGETWSCVGLKESRHVGRIAVHPSNPDSVYVAALGHLYRNGGERGLYRTLDGGLTWKRVLDAGLSVGAADLALVPESPSIVFASLWQVRRRPWALESGGPGSSLYMSYDGGDSWRDLGDQPGFPQGIKGRIGVAVSSGERPRVYALVEAKVAGLYVSDDLGESWDLVSDKADLALRPFYYMHVIAHPTDRDTVFVMNMRAWISRDAGVSFSSLSLDHGDQHALWIRKNKPNTMILGNDGGAVVSRDAGETWSSRMQQPIGAFYNVVADAQRPYRVYGAQQDSTTLSVPSRTSTGLICADDCFAVGGCESGGVSVTRDLPAVVYAVGYDGTQTRFEVEHSRIADISIWPEDRIGSYAAQMRYRFNWTTPIMVSRHERRRVYCACQFVFRSDDEGEHWSRVSEDLTRAEPQTLGPSGGPVTPDNYTAEVFGCIVALAEDPCDPAVVWAGSDDGKVYVTRDSCVTWTDVTPSALDMAASVTSIEPDPSAPGTVLVTASRERAGNDSPMVLVSHDWGSAWHELVEGLSERCVCYVARADPDRQGVVYLGTDTGVFVKWEPGVSWERFGSGLPKCPVYDLCVHEGDLIAATHGRSIWVFEGVARAAWARSNVGLDSGLVSIAPIDTKVRCEDLSVALEVTGDTNHGYVAVGDFVKARAVRSADGHDAAWVVVDGGMREPNLMTVSWNVRDAMVDQPIQVRVVDDGGHVVRVLTSSEPNPSLWGRSWRTVNSVWDMRYESAYCLQPERVWFMFGNFLVGPTVAPGRYWVEVLVAGGVEGKCEFAVVGATTEARSASQVFEQVRFLLEVRDRISVAHKTVELVRAIVDDASSFADGHSKGEEQDWIRELRAVEETLVSGRVVGPGDYHRYASGLNGRLMALGYRVSGSAGPVCTAHWAVLRELGRRQDACLVDLDRLLDRGGRSVQRRVFWDDGRRATARAFRYGRLWEDLGQSLQEGALSY